MRDRIGNAVQPGDLLMWLQNHMICEVVEVVDDDTPQVQMAGAGDGRHTAMGLVTIKFKLPVSREGMRPGTEPMLADFIHVVNPKATEAVDRLMSGPALPPRRKPS